jgi:hypothetical protein
LGKCHKAATCAKAAIESRTEVAVLLRTCETQHPRSNIRYHIRSQSNDLCISEACTLFVFSLKSSDCCDLENLSRRNAVDLGFCSCLQPQPRTRRGHSGFWPRSPSFDIKKALDGFLVVNVAMHYALPPRKPSSRLPAYSIRPNRAGIPFRQMKPTFVVIIAIGALTSIFLLFRVLVFSGTKSRSVAAFGVPSLGLANVVLVTVFDDRQDASIKELVKKNREIYAQSHGKKTSGSLSWCH